ncbi:hypothetical protein PC121_g20347 [Phytophthora cactorum]|nr:hypothetical protein PC121_g20347 [Phytophthora cactorum]
MPAILTVGTFEGELNDLMFGIVYPTQEIMRVKASYVKDYSDGAVLANIVVPTVEEPFRSVSVKWTQINLPLNQTGLVQNRDFVCLEATGILHFANGDRVGYQLLHSIDFPNTQPLPGTIRARHKIIGFYCQISRNVIDTYAFDTVHPGGKVFRSVALNACQSFSDADERFSQSVFTTKKKAVQMDKVAVLDEIRRFQRLKWRHNSHHLVWVFPSYMSVDIVARLDVLPASHVGLTPVVHYEALSTTPGIEFDRKHSFPSVADDFVSDDDQLCHRDSG